MKRAISVLLLFLLFLCGCSQSNLEKQINIEDFSYQSDCANYKDNPGVKENDFVNIEQSKVNDAEKAVDLAKKECTVEYDTIGVAFDSKKMIYRVSFYKESQLGGDQNVYIDQNGITLLIVYGE